MLMDTTMLLEAELHHIRQEMKYLKQLEADGPAGIQRGVRILKRREARVLQAIAEEKEDSCPE